MTGIHDDSDPGSAARQPPKVLAEWIRQLLVDVNSAQVPMLRELRASLQSDAFQWHIAPLAQNVSALHSAGRELHFETLRAGWFDRLTGRYRSAHAGFLVAHQRMVSCAARFKQETAGFGKSLQAHTAGARGVLVDFNMGWNALQAEVDRGVDWLQDMCDQLNETRARACEDDAQLETLAAHAQDFTHEFKRLQSAAAISREIGVRAQALLDRRAAVLERVGGDLDAYEKTWVRAVGKLAADINAGRTSPRGIPPAVESHDELMKRLEASADACSALQQEEHLLAQQLGRLREVLEAGRRYFAASKVRPR